MLARSRILYPRLQCLCGSNNIVRTLSTTTATTNKSRSKYHAEYRNTTFVTTNPLLRSVTPSITSTVQRFCTTIASEDSTTLQGTQEHEDDEEGEGFDRLLSAVVLKVRSMDDAVLKSYIQFMESSAQQLGLNVAAVLRLPHHVEKRTLLASPHIYNKHRKQYETRTYARMLELKDVTGDAADIYLEYVQRNIPEGVSMSIETTELEPMPSYIEQAALE